MDRTLESKKGLGQIYLCGQGASTAVVSPPLPASEPLIEFLALRERPLQTTVVSGQALVGAGNPSDITVPAHWRF